MSTHLGRGVVVVAFGAIVLGAMGCPPNEAIVCGSKTENTGPSCVSTYDLCAGGTHRLECSAAGGGVTCACLEDGVKKRSFESADACNVSPDTLRKRAAAGCGWQLDED